LWITPPWKTRETRIGPYGAFHGYWTEDPRTIDPRFGDDADVAALIGRLRADGMGLVIDFVGNHVAPGSPLLAEHPDWFHRNGDIVNWADPIEAVTHDVHGLPDLAQENRDVARYLIDAALHGDGFVPQGGGAALRPAGLRLDAVRHVPSDFFRALSSSMRAVDPEVVLIGELFDGSPSAVAETWRDGGFTAMFDFPMHFALVDVFCKGAHPGRIGAVLSQDRLYPDATKLAPFLDNHDTQRIASACSGDLDRVREAIAALYAMRGAPVITWGTEAGLLGAGEPENRADMPWGEEFPLLRDLQAAAALRASHPALSAPSPRVLALTDSLIAWSARSDRDHAVVAIHRGPGLVHLPLPDGGGWTALRGSIDGDSLVVGTGVAIARRWSIHVALDAPETVELQVTAAGAPSGELRLVGAGPELGDWRPKHGLSMPTTLRVRPGDVLQMKLVVVNVDGAASWEARSDRFVLVGDADQDLDLVWGA
jgi:glycosidase